MKRPLPPIPTPEGTPFQKFDALFRAVIAVPNTEIDKMEAPEEAGEERNPECFLT